MSDVIVGQDGYLFLDNDTNRARDQFAGKLTLSEYEQHAIAFCHKSREKILRDDFEAPYIHIVVPNKETVLQHLLPSDLRFQKCGLTPVNAYLESEASVGVPTFFRPNLLRRIHETEPVFARLDTHWTHAGAVPYFEAALKFGGLIEAGCALAAMPRETRQIEQAGDLGTKIACGPEALNAIAPVGSKSRLIFTNGIRNEGCVRIYRNEEAPVKKRVLVLHDSTAMWLFGFIAALFSEVTLIHYPDLDPHFVGKYRPNILLFIQIERFFVRVPRNDVSWADVVAKEEARKEVKESAVAFLRNLTLPSTP